MSTPTCALCGRELSADAIGYLGDGRLACVVVQACEARRQADAEDPETPAERRAALMSAIDGGYAAPEDFGLDDCDAFTGGNAWGPSAECGKCLEDQEA
jgi:hypothetical protein